MPFRPVTFRPSSNLAAAEYDEETKDLRITFYRNARTYVYHDVGADVVGGLERATSAGRYFNSFILDVYMFEEE